MLNNDNKISCKERKITSSKNDSAKESSDLEKLLYDVTHFSFYYNVPLHQ